MCKAVQTYRSQAFSDRTLNVAKQLTSDIINSDVKRCHECKRGVVYGIVLAS